MRNLLLFSILAIGLTFSSCQKEEVPKASFVFPDNIIANHEANFRSESTGGTVVRWNFGDGTQVYTDATVQEHTYTQSGIYDVSLTIESPSGEKSTKTESIIVSRAPNQIKVKKVTLKSLDFNKDWDPGSQTGPDVFFEIRRLSSSSILATGTTKNDITISQMPLIWNAGSASIIMTDIYNPFLGDYTIYFYDDDGTSKDLIDYHSLVAKDQFFPYTSNIHSYEYGSFSLEIEVEYIY